MEVRAIICIFIGTSCPRSRSTRRGKSRRSSVLGSLQPTPATLLCLTKIGKLSNAFDTLILRSIYCRYRELLLFLPSCLSYLPLFYRAGREIQELQKELERQKTDAQEAKKALEDMVKEEGVQKGELDPDEVTHQRNNPFPCMTHGALETRQK